MKTFVIECLNTIRGQLGRIFVKLYRDEGSLKFYFVLSIRILRILFLYKYSTFHLELLTTPTLLMIQISFTFSVPDADARRYCVGMWRKQRLVYHMLNFISTVCFQLKLVAWCFYLNILTVSLAVCERQSI